MRRSSESTWFLLLCLMVAAAAPARADVPAEPLARQGRSDRGRAAVLIAQAPFAPFPADAGGFGGLDGLGPSLQYPPNQPFPGGAGRPPAPPFAALPPLPPALPPRCPLIIKVGRGLAAPARTTVVSGRANCR